MEQNNRNKRSFGAAGENIAADYLRKNKYRILARNYRVGRLGEIDIIAREGEYICFIEVKTRKNILFGAPSEAVTKKKQANITKIASIYLSNYKLYECNVRFDIVEIIFYKDREHEINLIKNAF